MSRENARKNLNTNCITGLLKMQDRITADKITTYGQNADELNNQGPEYDKINTHY